MAIEKNNLMSGQVGNLVKRNVGGLQVVQTKPFRKVRPTTEMKRVSKDFGYASSVAKALRNAFFDVHRGWHDDLLHSRLTKQVINCMRCNPISPRQQDNHYLASVGRLQGFQFNGYCHHHDYVFLEPMVELSRFRKLRVRMPEFDGSKHLHIPKNCFWLEIQIDIKAFRSNFKEYEALGTHILEVDLLQEADNLFKQRVFSHDILDEQVEAVFVAMTVFYYDQKGNRGKLLNDRGLHPAALIGAFVMPR